jgi:tetratricopeptide (TPR) repeat protein
METNTFVPKLPNTVDKASKHLRGLSQFFLLAALALLPLLVVPQMGALTFFPKAYLVLFGAALSLLFVSLMVLRNGSVTLRVNPLLLSWWGVVFVGLLSAVLSPNLRNAMAGDVLEIHTVGFLVLLGLLMSLLPMIGDSKKFITYLYGSFVVSALLVSLLFLTRVLFGTEFLSFGLLQSLTDNFVGSFNDLGIFLGCIVMVALVTLAQLELPNKGLALVGLVLALALFVLANVNFFFVWLLVSLFSLMLLMYVLTKDRFGQPAGMPIHHGVSLIPTAMIGTVFMVSVVFLIGGNSLGTALSSATGVNYIEIRPSLTATIDIFRSVYSNQALTGIGPNQFSEAWSLYKDTSINDTIFWNTPFSAGAGYVTTWFVTTGILGVVAWMIFLCLFIYTGVRSLLLSKDNDSFWFYVGTVSFVAGFFIWMMAVVYVPGPSILLLGAVCTGTLMVAARKLVPTSSKTLNLLSSSKTGFILIAAVMICVIGVLTVLYSASKQIAAAYTFVTATNNIAADNPEALAIVSERIATAYGLYPTDTYARSLANYQLSALNTLLGLTEPTPAQQQEFQNAISAAINASTQAIAQKSTDARNWQVLGDIYAGLTLLNIEGAKDRAFETYKEAEVREPKNPLYVLQKAAIEARSGNTAEARRLAGLSLALKPNFTDALYFLSQLDIAAGDIPNAIVMTQSIISIEANNPGRYYQLGVLYGAIQETDAAIEAFVAAVTLNPSYANARYFLAQQYAIKGDAASAIRELEIVRDLNPDNVIVGDLIKSIQAGELNATSLINPTTVSEVSAVTTENGVTTTDTVPDTELLTPVNTGARTGDAPLAPESQNPQP